MGLEPEPKQGVACYLKWAEARVSPAAEKQSTVIMQEGDASPLGFRPRYLVIGSYVATPRILQHVSCMTQVRTFTLLAYVS